MAKTKAKKGAGGKPGKKLNHGKPFKGKKTCVTFTQVSGPAKVCSCART